MDMKNFNDIRNELIASIKEDINEKVLLDYRERTNEEILEYITSILDKYNSVTNNLMFDARGAFTRIFGWSIPDNNSLKEIVSFVNKDKLLEIAGGRGLWSKLFKDAGLSSFCTSIIDGGYYNEKDMLLTWCDVELLDAKTAMNVHQDCNCLFLSWGAGILHRYIYYFKGNKLAIVGEPYGGCTDAMTEKLLDETGFKLIKTVAIPTWNLANDFLFFYERL
jgi:hypothetical protein